MSKELTLKDLQDAVGQIMTAGPVSDYILCGPLEMLEVELGPLEVREGEVYRNDCYIGRVMTCGNVMVQV